MSIKKILMEGVIGFLLLTFSTFVWAGNVNLTLMADKSHTRASGTASISDNGLKIEAKDLRSNGVYTAWFVNMKPKKQEAGAGTMPYMFKTDSNGNGTYESSLPESPFGKWSMLMIVLHPTGDPKDMKNMVPALSAMIPRNK
ncbi:MAG: hypothetical protein ACYSW7_04530 [Planctomycetota bacterium]|jgi:hypothetical protein